MLTVAVDGVLRDDRGEAIAAGLAWVRREFRDSNAMLVYISALGAEDADARWLWRHRLPAADVVGVGAAAGLGAAASAWPAAVVQALNSLVGDAPRSIQHIDANPATVEALNAAGDPQLTASLPPWVHAMPAMA